MTPTTTELPADLRNFIKAASSSSKLPCPTPAGDGWGIVDASTFSPCLSKTQLHRIDAVCKGALSGHMGGGMMGSMMGAFSPSSMVPKMIQDNRAEAGLTAESAYAQVITFSPFQSARSTHPIAFLPGAASGPPRAGARAQPLARCPQACLVQSSRFPLLHRIHWMRFVRASRAGGRGRAAPVRRVPRGALLLRRMPAGRPQAAPPFLPARR